MINIDPSEGDFWLELLDHSATKPANLEPIWLLADEKIFRIMDF